MHRLRIVAVYRLAANGGFDLNQIAVQLAALMGQIRFAMQGNGSPASLSFQAAISCSTCHFAISTLRRLGSRITPFCFSFEKMRDTVSMVRPR